MQREALALASRLRAQGVRVELFPEPGRDVTKQIKYAAARRIPFAIVVGAREREAGRVGVRDLDSREQVDLSVDEVVAYLRERLLKAEQRKSRATRG